jgi:hypothetical protein
MHGRQEGRVAEGEQCMAGWGVKTAWLLEGRKQRGGVQCMVRKREEGCMIGRGEGNRRGAVHGRQGGTNHGMHVVLFDT